LGLFYLRLKQGDTGVHQVQQDALVPPKAEAFVPQDAGVLLKLGLLIKQRTLQVRRQLNLGNTECFS